MEEACFTNDKFPCHISVFVHTFCRLIDFSQDLNITFQDFYNIQSGHNVTLAELFKYGLFLKLSNNFGFHRNHCKIQIVYGNVTQGCYSLFQNPNHLFTGYAHFFHCILDLLSKIVFFLLQKQQGKHVFRKIEIIRVRHIVSSIAQQRKPVDFRNSSCK